MAHLRIVASINKRKSCCLALLVLLLPWVLLEELAELLSWYELGCSHWQRSSGPCCWEWLWFTLGKHWSLLLPSSRGEDCVQFSLQEKLVILASCYELSCFSSSEEVRNLSLRIAVLLFGIPDPRLQHCFLAPAKNAPPAGTHPSSHLHRHSSFHHSPWGLPSADSWKRLAWVTVVCSRPPVGS